MVKWKTMKLIEIITEIESLEFDAKKLVYAELWLKLILKVECLWRHFHICNAFVRIILIVFAFNKRNWYHTSDERVWGGNNKELERQRPRTKKKSMIFIWHFDFISLFNVITCHALLRATKLIANPCESDVNFHHHIPFLFSFSSSNQTEYGPNRKINENSIPVTYK